MRMTRPSLFLALAVLYGCSQAPSIAGKNCDAVHACPNGYACRMESGASIGQCETGCKDARDCPQGELCLASACVRACTRDEECPAAQTCVSDTCQTVNHECAANSDCTHPGLCLGADGAMCRSGLCVYLPAAAGTACDDGSGCTSNATCDANGTCTGQPMVCDQVPEPACGGNGVVDIYAGACEHGACVYTPTSASCASCPDSLDCLRGCMIDTNGDGAPERIADGAFAAGNGCLTCASSQSRSKWSAVSCAQVVPINVCRTAAGQCISGELGGTCAGQSCCVFGSSWPAGDAATQPQCPLGVEDIGGDGVRLGEVWTGVCTHDGNCAGCTVDAQCDDGNPCSIDACVLDVCAHDIVTEIGTACTTAGSLIANDGACTPVGNAIVCKPKLGATCDALLGGSDCASGHCVDSVCCESACDGVCAQCGGDGKCNVMPADDAACGIIDCDLLDNLPCRNYSDITSNRCASFGSCKTANTTGTCTSYTDATAGTECGARYCAAFVWMRQSCASGSCSGSATVADCNDGLTCTTDSCDSAAGCGHTNNAADCGICSICSGGGCVFDASQTIDCATNYTCYSAGFCRKANLQPCTASSDCASDICLLTTCLWEGATASAACQNPAATCAPTPENATAGARISGGVVQVHPTAHALVFGCDFGWLTGTTYACQVTMPMVPAMTATGRATATATGVTLSFVDLMIPGCDCTASGTWQ